MQKEIIREVVKIRCPYCGNIYDEDQDKCPYCGAKR
jgi:DNA-directed RNA polymerase subunit RPC12/RpoP